MKNIQKIILFSVLNLFLLNCTDDFKKTDTNPYASDPKNIDAGEYFNQIFNNIYVFDPASTAQLQQNLNADLFSGYMTNPRPFIAGANNGTYALVDGWNDKIFSVFYPSVMQNCQYIIDIAKDPAPVLYALALILRVEGAHRVADTFGPIVYTKFGETTTTPEYDSLENTYHQFFKDLDEAIEVLDENSTDKSFASYDLVYGGDLIKWIKFANSLRLRLSMRIANVDPSLSKTEAEKSLNHPTGVITANDENFYIEAGKINPLVTFNSSWNDTRMNASMESIMGGYEDPRLAVYFQPSDVVEGEYKGIRNGLPLLTGYKDEQAQKKPYIGFSKLGEMYDKDGTPITGMQLMTASEVYFLKAEAALKGYNNAGDPKANYEEGIRTSLQQYGLEAQANAYISDAVKKPKDYVDPVTSSNNITAQSSVTIAWDNASSDEEKLEKVITQKWIAVFPDGQEAWSEFRRTGYPKIFPVVSNQSNGTIDTDVQIRRLNFPIGERNTNPEQIEAATKLLKGPDNGGTRLWWDVVN